MTVVVSFGYLDIDLTSHPISTGQCSCNFSCHCFLSLRVVWQVHSKIQEKCLCWWITTDLLSDGKIPDVFPRLLGILLRLKFHSLLILNIHPINVSIVFVTGEQADHHWVLCICKLFAWRLVHWQLIAQQLCFFLLKPLKSFNFFPFSEFSLTTWCNFGLFHLPFSLLFVFHTHSHQLQSSQV